MVTLNSKSVKKIKFHSLCYLLQIKQECDNLERNYSELRTFVIILAILENNTLYATLLLRIHLCTYEQTKIFPKPGITNNSKKNY